MEKGSGGSETKISGTWNENEDTNVLVGASGNIRAKRGNSHKVDAYKKISDGNLGISRFCES